MPTASRGAAITRTLAHPAPDGKRQTETEAIDWVTGSPTPSTEHRTNPPPSTLPLKWLATRWLTLTDLRWTTNLNPRQLRWQQSRNFRRKWSGRRMWPTNEMSKEPAIYLAHTPSSFPSPTPIRQPHPRLNPGS